MQSRTVLAVTTSWPWRSSRIVMRRQVSSCGSAQRTRLRGCDIRGNSLNTFVRQSVKVGARNPKDGNSKVRLPLCLYASAHSTAACWDDLEQRTLSLNSKKNSTKLFVAGRFVGAFRVRALARVLLRTTTRKVELFNRMIPNYCAGCGGAASGGAECFDGSGDACAFAASSSASGGDST